MRKEITHELSSLRAERSSAAQAKAKLERILLEVLKGRRDLQSSSTPAVLGAHKRVEELERSLAHEIGRAHV